MLITILCLLYCAFRLFCAVMLYLCEKHEERAWEKKRLADLAESRRGEEAYLRYVAEWNARYDARVRAEAAKAAREEAEEEAMALRLREQAAVQKNLRTLRLPAMPKSVGELKRARNVVMLEVHPDVGGSDRFAADVNAAYNDIMRRLGLGGVA